MKPSNKQCARRGVSRGIGVPHRPPRIAGSRARHGGPVSAHRPGRGCPYRRAQELFAAAKGGWTLHQLRHSALTHLAEQNVALPLLMAKSRHTSLRSLQKYARPGVDAVAKLTAEHDPARRR
jgi:integrase